MENNTAIRIQGLSKEYKRGALHEASLVAAGFRFIEKIKQKKLISRQKKESFWVLKDINFEVKKGEILGVIGNNGAGKSTLLKLLAGITPPTKGSIEIFGRIAPMLEMGAGFHLELSGKDNIYLNGAILGMTRDEIEAHYLEILEFSGLSSFVETPLKHYSSGMHIRLAFAIAAFLQPEILLVDEILAVGDVAFQKKCLEKMEERASQGISILFVSHDLEAVKRLCSRCVYLEKGEVKNIGETGEMVEEYLGDQGMRESSQTLTFKDVGKPAYIVRIALLDQRQEYFTKECIYFKLIIKTKEILPGPIQIWMEVLNSSEKIILYSGTDLVVETTLLPDTFEINLILPAYTLVPGKYSFAFGIWNPNGWIALDRPKRVIGLNIIHDLLVQSDFLGEAPEIDCNWIIKKFTKAVD